MAFSPAGTQRLKPAVRAATTANVADLAAGAPDTVDGVTLAAEDRVLVKEQSTGSQNGIYRVATLGTGADGSWVRVGDFDQDAEARTGDLVFVSEGNANGPVLFQLDTPDPVLVGTTALTFSPVGGALLPSVDISVLDLYVNTSTGDDDNDGLTVGTPLATVQRAILMFTHPSNPPFWPGNEERVIHVVGNVTENVIVPPHQGEGILRIQTTEVVAETGLTTTGAFAQTAGTATEVNFTFSGGPITASAYANNAFAYPDAGSAEAKDEVYECLPIITNGTGDLTVVSADPGNWTSYDWGTAVAFSILQPGATWTGTTAVGGYDRTPCILNLGSNLIVQGFEFTSGTTPITNVDVGDDYRAILQRCIYTSCASLAAGGSVGINGIAQIAVGGGVHMTVGSTLVNVLSTGVLTLLINSARTFVYGLHHVNATIQVTDSTLIDMFLDCRSIQLTNTRAEVWKLAANGGNFGVWAEQGSTLSLWTTIDVTGTATGSYGIMVDTGSILYSDDDPSAATLSGSTADLRIGFVNHSWGAGSLEGQFGTGATYNEGLAAGKMVEATVDRVRLAEVAAPDTPAANYGVVYAKTDNLLYFKNDLGVEYPLTNGGNVTKVGTPVDNQIAVWTGDGTLEGDTKFLYDGASTGLLTVNSAAIFNDTAANVDFRVEGMADANVLVVDASALTNVGAVGIGIAAPTAKLHVVGGITQTTGALSLTGNAASALTTSSGALTLTSAAAATWGTAAGLLSINAAGGIVVNAAGIDADFVVSGDGDANTLVVDAGALTGVGAVGIGVAPASVTAKLHVETGDIKHKAHAAFAGSGQVQTTNAVQTTDATVTTVASFTLADNTVYWFEATIIGRDTSGTDRAFYIRSTLAYRQSAGSATLGALQTIVTDETNAAWDATLDVSTNDVRVRVTGAVATTINWACTLRYQGVSGNT